LLLKHSICFHREEVIIQKLCLRVLRLSNVVFSEQDLRRIRSLVMPLYLEKTTHDFVIPHEAVRLLHAVSGKMLDLSCIARQLEKVHDELIDLATTAMTSQNQDTNIYVFGNISGTFYEETRSRSVSRVTSSSCCNGDCSIDSREQF